MRLLLLTLVFPPDGVSTATIQGGIARELVARGWQVTVITTKPHYNRDAGAEDRQPLRSVIPGVLYRSDYEGVQVLHVRVRARGTRILRRAFDYAFFHLLTVFVALSIHSFDVAFAASPPLTIGVAGAIIAFLRHRPLVYNAQELYPDIAIDMGLLKNPVLIRLALWIEGFVYARATLVTTISDRFARRLGAKGVPPRKIEIIPNFAETDVIVPGPRNNQFAVQHGLVDKFVVLYAGNLGLTQDFDAVFAAAQRAPEDVLFLIVGGGARADLLRSEAERLRSRALRLLPYQSSAVVADMYAASSVGLVTLQADADRGTFPSKVYTVMSSGRPCIVIADMNSDAARLVKATGAGEVIPPGDGDALLELVLRLRDDRELCEEMGQRGREYVVATHSSSVVGAHYDKVLRAVRSTVRDANIET